MLSIDYGKPLPLPFYHLEHSLLTAEPVVWDFVPFVVLVNYSQTITHTSLAGRTAQLAVSIRIQLRQYASRPGNSV